MGLDVSRCSAGTEVPNVQLEKGAASRSRSFCRIDNHTEALPVDAQVKADLALAGASRAGDSAKRGGLK